MSVSWATRPLARPYEMPRAASTLRTVKLGFATAKSTRSRACADRRLEERTVSLRLWCAAARASIWWRVLVAAAANPREKKARKVSQSPWVLTRSNAS